MLSDLPIEAPICYVERAPKLILGPMPMNIPNPQSRS
jgi:hypothetical protein